jgi:hypothetical protein
LPNEFFSTISAALPAKIWRFLSSTKETIAKADNKLLNPILDRCWGGRASCAGRIQGANFPDATHPLSMPVFGYSFKVEKRLSNAC